MGSDCEMAIVKYRGKSVELDSLTLGELQNLFVTSRRIIAVIEEQLEYPLLLPQGEHGDVSGAAFALKQYKASIPLIEQAISAKRKQERIEQHERHNQPAAESAKERRQKTLAELFVQVAWERMNEPLFDAFMEEAKRRIKNGNI